MRIETVGGFMALMRQIILRESELGKEKVIQARLMSALSHDRGGSRKMTILGTSAMNKVAEPLPIWAEMP